MNADRLKQSFLRGFILFLVITAAIALFAVLKGEFDEQTFKALASSFTISAASICSMACAAYVEKHRARRAGLLGIACASLAALMMLLGIWEVVHNGQFWKTTLILCVLATASAHLFLLRLPQLDRCHEWVQNLSSILISLLAFIIILAIWTEIDTDEYFRMMTALSIVVVLCTLTIPILMKMRSDNEQYPSKLKPAQASPLLLYPQADDIYTDTQGIRYRLVRLKGEGSNSHPNP